MAPLEIYLTHLSRLISNLTKMPVGFPLVTDDKKFCSKGPFVCSAVVGTQLSGEYRKKTSFSSFSLLVFFSIVIKTCSVPESIWSKGKHESKFFSSSLDQCYAIYQLKVWVPPRKPHRVKHCVGESGRASLWLQQVLVHCCPVSLCWNDAETMHDRCIIYEDHLDAQLTTTGAQSAIWEHEQCCCSDASCHFMRFNTLQRVCFGLGVGQMVNVYVRLLLKRYNSNSLRSLRGMRVRSLGSYGSELLIEDFRERCVRIWYFK